jgi:hypothetical protein
MQTGVKDVLAWSDGHHVLLIDVFSCSSDNQQRLVAAWQRGTDEVRRYLAGLLSANVHRSVDGTKVINDAQWASREAFEASFAHPDVVADFNELGQIGTPAPVLAEAVLSPSCGHAPYRLTETQSSFGERAVRAPLPEI